MKKAILIIFLLFSVGCSDKPTDFMQEFVIIDERDETIIYDNITDPNIEPSQFQTRTGGIVFDDGGGIVIILTNPFGKEAKITFAGDKVKYSGELSVDESSKLFFDGVKFLLDGVNIEQ